MEFDPAIIKCMGCGHILILIADQKASADVDWPFARRLFQHIWAGFAAPAAHRKRPDNSFGMMGTKIKCINVGAAFSKIILHVRMERFYRLFTKVVARNTGLVSDDQYIVSGFVQQSHGFRRSVDPFELGGFVGIAVVYVKNAVAIEKCRRPAHIGSFGVFAAMAFVVGHCSKGLRMSNLPVQAVGP